MMNVTGILSIGGQPEREGQTNRVERQQEYGNVQAWHVAYKLQQKLKKHDFHIIIPKNDIVDSLKSPG